MADYDVHSNLGPGLLVICGVFSFLAILAVFLRLYVRLYKTRNFGLDDWLLVAGLIWTLSVCADSVVGVIIGGLGRHFHAITLQEYDVHWRIQYAMQILYSTALTIIKISILLMYRRMFPTTRFGVAITISGVVVIAWWIGFTATAIFQCNPVRRAWDSSADGTCISFYQLYCIHAVTNITTDILILVLPMPMVWQMQLPVRQKFVISGIFMLGGLVCISSIIRYINLLHVGLDVDQTYEITSTVVWTCIEVCLGIVSACLPTLKPLFTGTIIGDFLNRICGGIGNSTSKYGSAFSITNWPRGFNNDQTDDSRVRFVNIKRADRDSYNSYRISESLRRFNESERSLSPTSPTSPTSTYSGYKYPTRDAGLYKYHSNV